MDKSDILLFAVVAIALAFSLYRRYMKNKKGVNQPTAGKDKGSSFQSDSRDDDYEPYMKK
jgi:hypothetical protein